MTAKHKQGGGRAEAGKGPKARKPTKKKATSKRSPAKKPAARKKAAASKIAPRKAKARGRRPRRFSEVQRATAAQVLEALRSRYPDARCALAHQDAYELLVATILSAQCTDERVNMVTPELFATWPTPAALAKAEPRELEAVIHSTGFFRNKAKNLLAMARRLVDVYGGAVPRDMDDLLTLAGVARKTANVVRGVIWNLADGVVVDTHVKRIATRLGWTRAANPEHVEKDLMALHPQGAWVELSHVLIHHGRDLCPARKPRCEACPVQSLCPSALRAPAT